MASLRTKETREKYLALQAAGGLKGHCPLCEATALKTFTYWKILNNEFPYDKIASTHHMIVPLEHKTESEISAEAWGEFQQLKGTYLNDTYEFIIEATAKKKTIPAHFHVHLVIIKDDL